MSQRVKMNSCAQDHDAPDSSMIAMMPGSGLAASAAGPAAMLGHTSPTLLAITGRCTRHHWEGQSASVHYQKHLHSTHTRRNLRMHAYRHFKVDRSNVGCGGGQKLLVSTCWVVWGWGTAGGSSRGSLLCLVILHSSLDGILSQHAAQKSSGVRADFTGQCTGSGHTCSAASLEATSNGKRYLCS